jgi:hypothetical protein
MDASTVPRTEALGGYIEEANAVHCQAPKY